MNSMKPRETLLSTGTLCAYVILISTGLPCDRFHFCEKKTARSQHAVYFQEFCDFDELFDKFVIINSFVSRTVFASQGCLLSYRICFASILDKVKKLGHQHFQYLFD